MSTQHSQSTSTPVYTHDCDRCQFLGHFDGADLYFCEQNPSIGPTVLARYGNAGHQYTSGIGQSRHNLWLGEAYRIASNGGLLK